MDGQTVVTPDGRRPYAGESRGAPPVPPPGGYRGARRVPGAPTATPGTAPSPAETPAAPPSSVLSRIAFAAAAVLVFVLLMLWAAGSPGAIYGVGMLVAQLAVVILVVAALADPRGRRWGSIALALVVVVNVGTIGAASALTHPPASTPVAAEPGPVDDYWAGYPGIRGRSTDQILARPSLEEARRAAEALMADVRERLSAEFGVEWVPGLPGYVRNERNGYGGESMLVEYGSGTWATVDPVADYATKLDMMAVIDDVAFEHGFWGMIAFNDPATGFDPAYLERLYGGTHPRTQPEWEWYTDNQPGPIRFYAMISDLTHDDDGSFRVAREARVAGSSEPVEGLRIMVIIPEVLSEADVEEFLERMADYPGF